MISEQVIIWDWINLQCLVSIESEESECEQIKKFLSIVGAQVQILTQIEEKHEIIFIFIR